MKRPFYDSQDPFAQKRELDDQNFAIDHFYKKLLKLGEAMHTKAGHELAKKRIDFTQHFLLHLSEELDFSSAQNS
jgi:uncharacterized protein